ncbi:MAG: sulfite exporter TauE/SafE family protein [Ilumatobacteraceae bacterium]
MYGGYFGAGLGIMLLAVLGIVLHDRLDRLNALKQVMSFIINLTAALFFVTSGKVYWWFALVMAVTSLAGGSAGGRLAGRVQPNRLRAIVVAIGVIVGAIYAVRTWF